MSNSSTISELHGYGMDFKENNFYCPAMWHLRHPRSSILRCCRPTLCVHTM